jgi:hypothetical protein
MPILKFLTGEKKKPALGPQQQKGASRRRAVRKPQRLVEGVAEWPTMLYGRRCALKDISLSGARIELSEDDTNASRLPNEFTLRIVPDRKQVACEVVWRRGRLAGLRFIGPMKDFD